MSDEPKRPERRSQDQDSAVEGAFQNSTLPEEDRRKAQAEAPKSAPPRPPQSASLGHSRPSQPIERSPLVIPSIARESKWPSRGKIIFWTVAVVAAVLIILGVL